MDHEHDGYFYVQACLSTAEEMNGRVKGTYSPYGFATLVYFLHGLKDFSPNMTTSAKRLGLCPSRLTEIVTYCSKRGLVERFKNPQNLREFRLRLLPRGRELLKAIDDRTLALKMATQRFHPIDSEEIAIVS